MRRRAVNRGFVLALVAAAFGVATEARAAGWADKLFTESGHDFGPVPRGSKVRHNFVLKNTLNEPVTVVEARASCGCTTGRAPAGPIAPGQSAAVEAEMDTRNFVGRKVTVLFVTLATAGGRQAEVRLHVASTILSDIVLNPGTIDFGTVGRGETPKLSMTIDRAGAPAWRVERMLSSCRSIDATLVETARNDKVVSYLLTVSLKANAPVGPVRDTILVRTNDQESPTFPVQVAALVRGDLTATPSLVALGPVKSSEGAQGKFFVRSARPFKVQAIDGLGAGFLLIADNAESRPVHLLTVYFRPEESPARGDLRHAFRVRTDLAGEPELELTATARLDP